jgi:hypothetical protein
MVVVVVVGSERSDAMVEKENRGKLKVVMYGV